MDFPLELGYMAGREPDGHVKNHDICSALIGYKWWGIGFELALAFIPEAKMPRLQHHEINLLIDVDVA